MEATAYTGEGMIVIADDDDLPWPKRVLAEVQAFAIQSGFYVRRMMSQVHQYHLDDAPELRSCNLVIGATPDNKRPGPSAAITDKARLENFYGRSASPRVRYVRERKRLDYGKAHDDEYELELLDGR
jgi:hypothetical protein